LTHGKKGYEGVWEEVEEAAVRAQALKDALLRALDEDTEAFNRVMAAMRLPKKTDEQKAAREAAMQEATRAATRIPYGICESALASFDAIETMAAVGNENSISDAGVAAHCARTAVHGAALNVRINLPGIEDEAFVREMREGVERMTAEADRRLEGVLKRVEEVLAKQGVSGTG
ncbi:MAG TPA: glutamate formimidoyltransferase, partial [Bacteroidetes bacterium]|nr:glutamate formimidoyltransferase [Bacteroidota bacterium]